MRVSSSPFLPHPIFSTWLFTGEHSASETGEPDQTHYFVAWLRTRDSLSLGLLSSFLQDEMLVSVFCGPHRSNFVIITIVTKLLVVF